MGTETLHGRLVQSCNCGNLLSLDDYQRPIERESGVEYELIIRSLATCESCAKRNGDCSDLDHLWSDASDLDRKPDGCWVFDKTLLTSSSN